MKLRLKGVLAKNEKGYRLTAKNNRAWSLLILLLSVASIMRKLLKTKLVPKKVESIQIEKVATNDSNHKNINLISNHSDITNNSHRLFFDAFVNSCYFWFWFFFVNNILLALDFRTFLENMKMSSSKSKILEAWIKVFKSNSNIMKNTTIYECVEK